MTQLIATPAVGGFIAEATFNNILINEINNGNVGEFER